MRAAILSALALLAAAPALGQTAAVAPAPPQAQADEDSLRQRLLAAQQRIAVLERELADQTSRSVALDQCRTKNGALVTAGKELIAGYDKRYRRAHRDPLQLGRRHFEAELQGMSEAIYDNRVDVPVRPAAAAPAPGDQPVKGN